MTTPVVMLILLATPWVLTRIWVRIRQRPRDLESAGRIGLTLVFMFSAVWRFASVPYRSKNSGIDKPD